jgi:hypothetical protein
MRLRPGSTSVSNAAVSSDSRESGGIRRPPEIIRDVQKNSNLVFQAERRAIQKDSGGFFDFMVSATDERISQGIPENQAYEDLVKIMKDAFLNGEDVLSNQLLSKLRKRPGFIRAVVENAGETIPALFGKHSSGRSLYDEIEFGILLLS